MDHSFDSGRRILPYAVPGGGVHQHSLVPCPGKSPNQPGYRELISEDGVVIATFHIENRSYVQYEDLSESLKNAVLATEDIRFYRHSGD